MAVDQPNQMVFVDTPERLSEVSARLAQSAWVALDTEFLRDKTYYPKLCLLQLATPDWVACVDTLTLELDPLLDVVYDPAIIKVMHSSGQDLEIFYHLRGDLPGPIFDTQLAAPLLGHPEQVGYGALVKETLQVSLDKAHTRADWSRRPLTDDQLRYAADDVVYLVRLYSHLRSELEQLNRLSWLEEDFDALLDVSRYAKAPDEAWQRIKGADRLKGGPLSVLQTLAAWRERTARHEDRPRSWILRDDSLLNIAQFKPGNLAELGRIRGVNERTVRRHGAALLALVQESKDRPPEAAGDSKRAARPSAAQEALVDTLLAIVRMRCHENRLNPTVLTSRKELHELLMGDPSVRLLHGWRKNIAGEQVLAFLRGEAGLQVQSGELTLTAWES
jgi:ribonuclease D